LHRSERRDHGDNHANDDLGGTTRRQTEDENKQAQANTGNGAKRHSSKTRADEDTSEKDAQLNPDQRLNHPKRKAEFECRTAVTHDINSYKTNLGVPAWCEV
jgi:hypothetical protein